MPTLHLNWSTPRITLAPEALPPEVFAAEQLSYYLSLITGRQWPVGEGALPPADDLPAGAYSFAVTEQEAVLSGAEPLALLHAVYHFLEAQGGCRWLSIWEGGEIIPRDPEMALTPCSETHVPAFSHRAFTNYPDIDRDTVHMVDWMAKNRFNRFMVFANVEGAFERYQKVLKDELLIRGMQVMLGHHSFKYWLPPAEHFGEHPEWFALVNGERIADGQICTSNPEVVELVADRIAGFFTANPEVDMVGLWPNDCFGWCECEACAALEPQRECEVYAPYLARTDTYVQFLNAVAGRLAVTHPDRRLGALAYVNYVEPPTIPLAPGIAVCFAPFCRCLKHPLDAPAECTRPNLRYAEYHAGWRERVADELYLFGYLMQIDMCSIPFRLTRMLGPYFRWLQEAGGDGYVMEYKPQEWGVYGVNAHVIGRLSWEPEMDVDAWLRGHYADLYGPAAQSMTAHFEALLDLFVEPGPCVYHYDLTYAARATAELLAPALVHLAEARVTAAAGDRRHRDNVERARTSLELLLRTGEWQRAVLASREAAAAGSPADANKRAVLSTRARQAGQELLTWAQAHAKSGVVDFPYLRGRVEAEAV